MLSVVPNHIFSSYHTIYNTETGFLEFVITIFDYKGFFNCNISLHCSTTIAKYRIVKKEKRITVSKEFKLKCLKNYFSEASVLIEKSLSPSGLFQWLLNSASYQVKHLLILQ
jgi:hypothetical protein